MKLLRILIIPVFTLTSFWNVAPLNAAQSFSQVTIQLMDSSGAPITELITSCYGKSGDVNVENQKSTNADGRHQVACPSVNGATISGTFSFKECPIDGVQARAFKCISTGSVLSRNIDVSQNRDFRIVLPPLSFVTLRFVDAKGAPVTAASVSRPSFSSGGGFSTPVWSSGTPWEFSSTLAGNVNSIPVNKSEVQIPVFSNGLVRGFSVTPSQGVSSINTGLIKTPSVDPLKVCLPINIVAGGQYPSDCYDGFKSAFQPTCNEYNRKVAELTSPVIAEMKAMADQLLGRLLAMSERKQPQFRASIEQHGPLANAISTSGRLRPCTEEVYRDLWNLPDTSPEAVSQDNVVTTIRGNKSEYVTYLAEISRRIDTQLGLEKASLKPQTITCKKGSLTKKVTSTKPICPAGYKKA